MILSLISYHLFDFTKVLIEFKAEENISKDTSDRLGMILHKEVVNKSKSSKKQA